MRKRNKGNFEQTAAPLLFLLPNLFVFTVFIIIPAFRGLSMSAFGWGILSEPVFTGWTNFAELVRDGVFWRTFANTVVYSVFAVPLSAASALLLALLLQDNAMGGVKVFRSLFYLPSLLSMITVGISWRFLLGDEMGAVNYGLRLMGFTGVHWLSEALPAMGSVILISVWAGAGYYMVIVLAGLQAIPTELYEAARIDGASAWTIFRRITLPMLRGTMLVVMVLATIASFKAYELIVVLTQGGPGYATKFIVQQVYQSAFIEDRMGYASAMSIVLLLLIVAITSAQFIASGRDQDYE